MVSSVPLSAVFGTWGPLYTWSGGSQALRQWQCSAIPLPVIIPGVLISEVLLFQGYNTLLVVTAMVLFRRFRLEALHCTGM